MNTKTNKQNHPNHRSCESGFQDPLMPNAGNGGDSAMGLGDSTCECGYSVPAEAQQAVD